MSEETDGTQAAALLAVLALEEREPDLFVGQTPRTAMQRIFGGQVAGQALMAATRTLPEGRAVHSLHSYFLRPGDPQAEIRYAVERMRDGRTFSTRRVVAWQRRGDKDAAIFVLTADASAGEAAVAQHALPMPDVPEPESLPTFMELMAARGDETRVSRSIGQAVEQRLLEHPWDRPPKTYPDTKSWAWMRVFGQLPDDQAVHAAALTFASDLSLLGAGTARLGGGWGTTMGSSLDHAVWFHQPVRADEWFLYETDSPVASHGRALCFGQIWSADGSHVATVTQQGLIRSLER
ncbi:acyl-CoA thioesterase [Candidatus Blastococcus massiliensis]|uniref:acyl-CoA thioesterase n=1 Tax=Candidatus Blastococcus massiliensis TaxID=1470358 RepID=UPI0004B50FDE|nr:acyl-CoA thioesterase domain-containing protein [Candidatus Blastococcus massiliensis]